MDRRSRWHCAAVGLAIILVPSVVFAEGVAGGDLASRKHLNLLGKPCLESTGSTTPLASNPRIQNHLVSLNNRCPGPIKATVCYYKSDECVDVDVPGYSRREQVLGVFPAIQQFRYEVKERF